MTAPMSERDLQAEVVDLATRFGWLVYHTYRSTRSEPGFPDLVLVRSERLIFAELKSEAGKLTMAQENWMVRLSLVPGIEAVVWRPSDLEDVAHRLSRATPVPVDFQKLMERER